MEYVALPNIDLLISRIGFGAEPLGGADWGDIDEQLAIEAVAKALALGVNLFDTADVYGLGRSEELLSEALGVHRHDAVIVTKFGVNWQPVIGTQRARTFFDSSPKHVYEAVENSLRRLRIDSIPIYLIHWPDPMTPFSETLEALQHSQQAGKIRYFGVSNFSLEQLKEACRITAISVIELQYSLLDRAANDGVLSFCMQQQIGVLVYGTLGQGLLTGKFSQTTKFHENDRRSRLASFQGQQFLKNLQCAERVKYIAEKYAKQPAQVATRWALEHPAVSCAIVGAKTPAQVESNVGVSGWKLTKDDAAYLEQDKEKEAG